MKVLVIPEDFRKDQFILKPIVEALFAEAGKPHADVNIVKDPVVRGVHDALRWTTIERIISVYRMFDVFLLIVDRDGDPNRRARLDEIERQAAAITTKPFLAENAWQEIEVWAIAAQAMLPDRWATIRAEKDAKERYFEPLARERNLLDKMGQGRQIIGLEAARNYRRVRKLCPEVQSLEDRIRAAIGG